MAIRTFQLPYSETAVQDLRERLARTRWPETMPGSGWEYGFDLAYLQRICRYWREEFDWKAEIEAAGRPCITCNTSRATSPSILFTRADGDPRRSRSCCCMAGPDRFLKCGSYFRGLPIQQRTVGSPPTRST